ncbi:Gfo/Idh/MocA family protein [Bacillus sp. B-jedd]|uniref:Gfo/Idh/MocA family protein n=1 Tax=Bacillus sp. B-jedd TaxID=1476857 RepID=UPI000515568D|nr:Gfo/Idh/MocA family oxidoreductase [Bacillus sp. B-jedd]CEG26444.1 NADH-dependent dyhydrogenase [Bacillus sp. B-jedd]
MQKILMIGAGTMGMEHAASYYAMEDVQLVGIVDLRKEQAEKIIGAHDTKVFATIEEAVESLEQIDVIDICVPTFLHKEYVIKAADYGIDVICEKPLSYSLQDAREMIDYCKAKNVKLFVGHVVRFFPQYAQVRELIQQGAIGEIGVVRTRRGGNFPAGWGDWYADHSKSGGVILDLIIHDFDFLRWTFGEVERVFAKGLAGRNIEHLDYALVTLVFESGVIAHVEGSWAHQTFSTQFEFAGKKGILEYDSLKEEPVLLSVRESAEEKGGVAVPQSPLKVSPYRTELEHFLDCLKTNETPIVTAEDAYKAMEISAAALQSLKTGLPVTLAEQRGEQA